ncbi:hypothetical protein [Pedobacter sp. Leaf176]|uniref:hypothetical protein n=1 Tax=Pedobacter sp. Leaf176 TaxID=1736286 RepID=UPI0006F746A5|nr:hypothetical protein [Pedobacter sp. Leaf176]KQR67666.1 hypothetical protein ASF92_18505 [Pedobacter sp. Leaf176]
MSNTSLIKYKNKGFWINENFMQLLFNYLYIEVQKKEYVFVDKQDLLEELNEGVKGWYKGYFSLSWEEILKNTSDEQNLIKLLQNMKIILQNKGLNISAAELQSINVEDDTFNYLFSRKPFPIIELNKIIDALIEMLNGTWNYTNYRMEINYQY